MKRRARRMLFTCSKARWPEPALGHNLVGLGAAQAESYNWPHLRLRHYDLIV